MKSNLILIVAIAAIVTILRCNVFGQSFQPIICDALSGSGNNPQQTTVIQKR